MTGPIRILSSCIIAGLAVTVLGVCGIAVLIFQYSGGDGGGHCAPSPMSVGVVLGLLLFGGVGGPVVILSVGLLLALHMKSTVLTVAERSRSETLAYFGFLPVGLAIMLSR